MANQGAFTFEQLTSVETLSEAIGELKTLLTGSGFNNINDWNPGTYQYDLLQLCAYCYVAGQQRAATLALNSMVPTSSGSFTTNLADSFFDIQRGQGVQTQGQLRLTLTPGRGPFTLGPGQLTVTYNGTYTYTNNDTFSLTGLAPTADVLFTATDIGSASDINVPTNAGSSYFTVSPGLYVGITANNPAIAGTTSWIYVHGSDEETDDALQLQCSTKWAKNVTAEAVSDRFINLVLSCSAGTISEVSIDPTQPNGPGTVLLYCATTYDVAASGDIAKVSGSVQAQVFNGANLVRLQPATALHLGGGGINTAIQVFYAPSTSLPVISASVSNALQSFIGSVPVGGTNNAPLYFGGSTYWADIGLLEDALYNIPQVRNVNIINRSNIAMSPHDKLVAPVGGWSSPAVQLTASLR